MELKVKVGNAYLTFDGRDVKECLKEGAAFAQLGSCCCGSANVSLEYRKVKGKEGTDKAGQTFEYMSVKCNDCHKVAQIGEYNGGGLFAKRWETPAYMQNSGQQQADDMAEMF